MTNQNRETRYRTIFNRCDGNNDGYISVGELEHFINSNSEDAKVIQRSVVKKIHRMAHEDDNKKMDYRQFVNLMESRNLRYIFENCFTKYINFVVPYKPDCPMSFDGERLINSYSFWPPPFFILLITTLQLSFLITDLVTGGVVTYIFMYDPKKRHEIWRYLTVVFVHAGVRHIYGNIVIQLLLGIPLEKVYGWWRIMIILFAGTITGTLSQVLVTPHLPGVGASGGDYALLTAHIPCVILTWKDAMCPCVHLTLVSIYVLTDVVADLYNIYYKGNITTANVAIEGHAGGAVTGVLLGIYILRHQQATGCEKYVYWAALTVYFLLVGCAIVLIIGWPGIIKQPGRY